MRIICYSFVIRISKYAHLVYLITYVTKITTCLTSEAAIVTETKAKQTATLAMAAMETVTIAMEGQWADH